MENGYRSSFSKQKIIFLRKKKKNVDRWGRMTAANLSVPGAVGMLLGADLSTVLWYETVCNGSTHLQQNFGHKIYEELLAA